MEGKVRSMVSSWTNNEVDEADEVPPPTPPLPLKPLKYLSKEKKTYTLKPHHCPLLFSYSPPSSYLPLSLTPFLPQPSLSAPGFCCTNQEQMSAGAVLKDPAVLDASHMLFIQR